MTEHLFFLPVNILVLAEDDSSETIKETYAHSQLDAELPCRLARCLYLRSKKKGMIIEGLTCYLAKTDGDQHYGRTTTDNHGAMIRSIRVGELKALMNSKVYGPLIRRFPDTRAAFQYFSTLEDNRLIALYWY